MVKPMVFQGQIWKDCHGDYVHVDSVFSYDIFMNRVEITRIHDNKKLKLTEENFIKNFNLHETDNLSMVGKVLTDVYNDFFIIETYMTDEQCYLLRNVKSTLVELFALDEVDKYFEVYEYDQEG